MFGGGGGVVLWVSVDFLFHCSQEQRSAPLASTSSAPPPAHDREHWRVPSITSDVTNCNPGPEDSASGAEGGSFFSLDGPCRDRTCTHASVAVHGHFLAFVSLFVLAHLSVSHH